MKVLIVVDMQKDFITGPLSTSEARAIVPKVCDLIGSDYGEVCYTMDTHDMFYLDTPEGKKLPIEHCIYDTKGWDLDDDIQRAIMKRNSKNIDNQTVEQIKVDSFGNTALATMYRGVAETTGVSFDICGVCTDICVISNALLLKTYYPFSNIRVIASACAGTTPEMHQKALDVMRSCQIEVVE